VHLAGDDLLETPHDVLLGPARFSAGDAAVGAAVGAAVSAAVGSRSQERPQIAAMAATLPGDPGSLVRSRVGHGRQPAQDRCQDRLVGVQ